MGPLIAFTAGLVFGIGLLISGMTDPARVLAFLDVAGAWNPALALVMGGAVAVTLPAFAYARRHGHTLGGAVLTLPDRKTLTPQLLIGSALFGIGWGLSGVCPGPAILIALSGQWQPLLFLASVAAGIGLHRVLLASREPAAKATADCS
ncbi:MAG: YeeE/YedE family protein [Nevskiaceae bacterium]|nr:MAG: YeeE/YedE family protein [Nevskiaceae bacterium]